MRSTSRTIRVVAALGVACAAACGGGDDPGVDFEGATGLDGAASSSGGAAEGEGGESSGEGGNTAGGGADSPGGGGSAGIGSGGQGGGAGDATSGSGMGGGAGNATSGGGMGGSAGDAGTATDAGSPGGGTGGTGGTSVDASSGNASAGGSAGVGGTAASDGGGIGAYVGQPVVSGTRLKAMHVAYGDGSRTYRRGQLYDSQVDAPCEYQTAADGVLRCLPVIAPKSESGIFLYRDAACTDRYALIPAPTLGCAYTAVFAYYSDFTPLACSAVVTTHVHPLTGTIYANPPKYRIRDGVCESLSASYANRIAVSVGPEIAATEFVAGTETTQP